MAASRSERSVELAELLAICAELRREVLEEADISGQRT